MSTFNKKSYYRKLLPSRMKSWRARRSHQQQKEATSNKRAKKDDTVGESAAGSEPSQAANVSWDRARASEVVLGKNRPRAKIKGKFYLPHLKSRGRWQIFSSPLWMGSFVWNLKFFSFNWVSQVRPSSIFEQNWPTGDGKKLRVFVGSFNL